MKTFEETNLVISCGSLDGVLTTAAFINHIEKPYCQIEWVQSFALDKIETSKLKNKKITLIDLAVDTRSKGETTKKFLQNVQDQGGEIIAIIDEHNGEKWREIVDFNNLIIKPRTADSSGQVLYEAVKKESIIEAKKVKDKFKNEEWRESLSQDAFGELCELAHVADTEPAKIQENKILNICNMAIKANIADNNRRDYIARQLSSNIITKTGKVVLYYDGERGQNVFEKIGKLDAQILQWASEYNTLQDNMNHYLDNAKIEGNKIVIELLQDKPCDKTNLCFEVYKKASYVVMHSEIITENGLLHPSSNSFIAHANKGGEKNLLELAYQAKVKVGGDTYRVNIFGESHREDCQKIIDLI